MSHVFEPVTVGGLQLRNRLMRSATAERMSDARSGAPTQRLAQTYAALAAGGVGLIVTGHACVERAGKAHPRMSAIDDDGLIAPWRAVIAPAQRAGARVMLQINHCGASADPAVNPAPLSPSGVATNPAIAPREMTEDEIARVVAAFGQAARRARAAGFDGVQIHGAHGYLVTQFLSRATNRRDDGWGGDAARRRAFLLAVIAAMRQEAGADYPVWIKLGVAGAAANGLVPQEGACAAAACARAGVGCIEVSHGQGIPEDLPLRGEAVYLPLAQAVRAAVGPTYPLALVSGFRSLGAMSEVLAGGVVQLVSLCRPLIAEPELPNRLAGGQAAAECVRCSRCWPSEEPDWVRCRDAGVLARLTGLG
ncbi:MAG: NADH:flavin oxidoreductase [Chloroflexota bacterium]